jgi:hypothetical protein
MPLLDLDLPVDRAAVPRDARSFLREATRRIERFRRASRTPAFVPSNFAGAYRALRALAADLTPGRLFCEWGSGLGVVACLAALLGFDACGIEIEGELVEEARRLAEDFDLPVEFVRGSFIPAGAAGAVAEGGEFCWLTAGGASPLGELGLAPEDFGVIYAYPWPDEEGLTADLFERHAAAGAVLLTHHGGGAFRLRGKAGGRPGPQGRRDRPPPGP